MLRRYGSGPPRWVQAGRLAGAVVLQDVPQALWMPAAVIAIASRPSMPGPCQSAASQSASRSIARSRIRGEGGISGMGGRKIGSLRGLGQAGNAGPRSA